MRRRRPVALVTLVGLLALLWSLSAAGGARGAGDTGVRDASTASVDWITVFGVIVLSFMMVMYALERRHRRFVLLFALGCVLSSLYGFASGAWPFGVVEAIWAGVALARYRANDVD